MWIKSLAFFHGVFFWVFIFIPSQWWCDNSKANWFEYNHFNYFQLYLIRFPCEQTNEREKWNRWIWSDSRKGGGERIDEAILNGWKNNRSNDNAWWRKKLRKLHKKRFQNISHNSHGNVKFHLCAQIRVSIKSDRYANAHGFFTGWVFVARFGAGSFISVTFSWFFFSPLVPLSLT